MWSNGPPVRTVAEPLVPDLAGKLAELKRAKERQDAERAQQLLEADEKFEMMKELLLTEHALLRKTNFRSFHCFRNTVS